MASTVFINNNTVIVADWLNDVNAATYLTSGSVLTAETVATELANKVPRTTPTGSATLPSGTTAQRDATPIDGMIRYNSTLLQFEGYFNGLWQSVGGGQLLGNASIKGIFYNANTISENITIVSGTNGHSAGPIAITPGFSVVIEPGATWKVL